uniref:NADH dehydrogenase subunit 4L n=1 Tax=Glyphohesione klatti TaxID=3053539 RepID=UPI0030E06137
MLPSLFFLSPIMILTSILSIISQRKHIMMALLSLEAMILSLMMLFGLSLYSLSLSQLFLPLLVLSFGACESSLGLACLVAMIRTYGNDRITSLSLSKC